MRYSILHLSDLHRDINDEVPNEWLLDSLERDVEVMANEGPAPPRPSICVVSGDLVYGVLPTAKDAVRELQRQNEQALDFLIGVSDQLFGGDREKVVILPGNHDVSYPKVSESCVQVPPPATPEDRAKLVKEFFSTNSELRWSWSELAFFRITDTYAYSERLASFAWIYDQFYKGQRTYSLNPEDQFDLFDYPDLKLSMLALCSCHGNDPWQRAAKIHPKAMAGASRRLRSVTRSGWLLAAAWHHNLTGGPSHNDYLDPSFLQVLIDSGVSIGLHGHQHRPDWFDQPYRLGTNNRRMVVTSAATLCAGPSNLNPGTPRGYNILEIDSDNWKARLHQRQMVNSQFDMPIWGPGHFVDTSLSYVDFDLSPPLLERPAGLDLKIALETADAQLGQRQWAEVLRTLSKYLEDEMARRMCARALQELDDDSKTIEVFSQPRTAEEAVLLGHAILRKVLADAYDGYLADPFVSTSADASVREIVARIEVRRGK